MEQVNTLQQQLKEQEKLASLGMLSAGIAHEIQNPLNFVINFSKLSVKLVQDLEEVVEANKSCIPADDYADISDIIHSLSDNMSKIAEHGDRAVDIIRSILLVSRGKEDEFLPTDVCRTVKEYVWLSFHALRAKHQGFNISIHEEYDEGLPVMMLIPQDLSRAVLNLMNNACYAVWDRSQKEGEQYVPTIDIKTVLNAEGMVEITIQDNAEGMTDEVKEHLFDNFFTTKPVGQGTGLGMGITRDIVENKHHGKLTFESEIGKGTCFTIIIPVKKP
jgi:signal transduction histidine kinase